MACLSLRACNLCSDGPISKLIDAFNSSQNYLSNGVLRYKFCNLGFSELEFLKLWKGLHTCMWHSDKPLVQVSVVAVAREGRSCC